MRVAEPIFSGCIRYAELGHRASRRCSWWCAPSSSVWSRRSGNSTCCRHSCKQPCRQHEVAGVSSRRCASTDTQPGYQPTPRQSLLTVPILPREHNRRHITPSPALMVESIQPKHNASSTASRYCSPSGLLVVEIHISRFVEWFSMSHSRHCSREVVCSLSVISILSAYLLQS